MSVEETVKAAAEQNAGPAELQALIDAAVAAPADLAASLDAHPDAVAGLFGFHLMLRRGDALSRTLAKALAETRSEAVAEYVGSELPFIFTVEGLGAEILAAAHRAGWADRLRPAVTNLVQRAYQDMLGTVRDDGRGGPGVQGAAGMLARRIEQMPPVLRDQAIWAVRGAPNRAYEGGGPDAGTNLRWMTELVLAEIVPRAGGPA